MSDGLELHAVVDCPLCGAGSCGWATDPDVINPVTGYTPRQTVEATIQAARAQGFDFCSCGAWYYPARPGFIPPVQPPELVSTPRWFNGETGAEIYQ